MHKAYAALAAFRAMIPTSHTYQCLQILTHMKEKLQYIEADNSQLKQQLQQLDAALAGRRDELASLKATRDKVRQQGRQMKEGNVYVSNPILLQDMQVRLCALIAKSKPSLLQHCDVSK